MEFFARVPGRTDAAALQRALTIAALPRWCDAIESVLRDDGDAGEIFCLWGTFVVHREPIRDGVRFTLPGCPNGVAWTVTAGADAVTVHCTIYHTEHEPDFVESLETFTAAWARGLTVNHIAAAG